MPKKETAISLQRAALRQSGALRKTVLDQVTSLVREVREKEAERQAQAQAITDTAAGVARMEQQLAAMQAQLEAAREDANVAKAEAKANADALQATLQIALQNQSLIADLVFTGTSRSTLTAWTAAQRLEGLIAENEVVRPVEARFCPKPTHEVDGRLGWLEVPTAPGSPWRYPDLDWRKS